MREKRRAILWGDSANLGVAGQTTGLAQPVQ